MVDLAGSGFIFLFLTRLTSLDHCDGFRLDLKCEVVYWKMDEVEDREREREREREEKRRREEREGHSARPLSHQHSLVLDSPLAGLSDDDVRYGHS